MKLSKIIETQEKDLDALIEDQRKVLAALWIDLRTKKLNNIKEIAGAKRTIARALTIKRQRQIAAMESAMVSGQGESDE